MRQSEYRLQLREKQKTRRYYQILEKQFRSYYDKASRQPGVTGENLLRLLESRFDNVLVRLGFAASRRQARQMIRHGHWMINGRRVDIPSYNLRPEDVISIKADTAANETVRRATELVSAVPAWLQADHDALTAKVLRLPERSEISAPVQEQLIVELYSK
jgi:small subunit ribosomal protein S4